MRQLTVYTPWSADDMATRWDRNYPLLITGCPRSGTRWLWEVLRAHGLDLGHEYFRPGGVVSSLHTGRGRLDSGIVDGSEYTRYTAGAGTNYGTVIHLMRDTLSCISSLRTMSRNMWQFALDNCPPLEDYELPDDRAHGFDDPVRIRFAMAFNLAWNLKVQNQWARPLIYKLEDLTTDRRVWNRLCEAVGVIPRGELYDSETRCPSRLWKGEAVHSKVHLYKTKLTWDDLMSVDDHLCGMLLQHAKKAGYLKENDDARTE